MLVAAAVYTDLRSARVLNVTTIPGILLGLLLNGWMDGDVGVLRSLEGITLSMGFLVLSLTCGGCMGGGDIKLLGAVGALCGPKFLLISFCIAALAGGVMATAVAVRHRQFIAASTRCLTWVACRAGTRTAVPLLGSPGALHIPYAVAIAAGVVATTFWPGLSWA